MRIVKYLAALESYRAAAISPLAARAARCCEADTVAAQVEAVARFITDTGLAQTLAEQSHPIDGGAAATACAAGAAAL